MSAFAVLQHYRTALLAAWEAQPAALAAAWQALSPSEQALRGAGSPYETLLALCRWEEKVGFPNLRALLQGEAPHFVLPEALPPLSPAPDALLEAYAGRRRQALASVRKLGGKAWSRLGRHPHFGQRTVQWWVEHSLAAGRVALRRLSPEEVSP